MLDHAPAGDANFWIFREGKRPVASAKLLAELQALLREVQYYPGNKTLQLDALIRAGELEAAIADSGSTTPDFAELTDHLACALISNEPLRPSALTACRDALPEMLTVSPPEGFSYYAVHPLDFAEAAGQAANPTRPTAVIGIRSIGTTLSAVAAAALRQANSQVERITVRPTGHPYERITRFDDSQGSWITRHQSAGAKFLVVDEGPGRSGSTFLSVAEALVTAGVARQDIILLGSRTPDLSQLCAHEAASRWTQFRFVSASNGVHARFRDHLYLGGGEWRRVFLSDLSNWPPCWPQMERVKFLSPDRRRLFKFEGLGATGRPVRERARQLACAGFGCEVEDAGEGFSSYAVAAGPALQAKDASAGLLARIADYCAFRQREFQVAGPATDPLAEMLSFNVAHEFGVEPDLNLELLQARQVIIADGRMQPHEWVRTANGQILKTDASSHGDDHFFPGPSDVAWDLAGAAVEWSLSADAVAALLSRFASLTGDDVRPRWQTFVLAYSVFRLAMCKMAITTVPGGSIEAQRLHQAYLRYRRRAIRHLPQGLRFLKPGDSMAEVGHAA